MTAVTKEQIAVGSAALIRQLDEVEAEMAQINNANIATLKTWNEDVIAARKRHADALEKELSEIQAKYTEIMQVRSLRMVTLGQLYDGCKRAISRFMEHIYV